MARPRAAFALTAAVIAGALWAICGIVNWLILSTASTVHHDLVDLIFPATFARPSVLDAAGVAVEVATTVFVALVVGIAAWWAARGRGRPLPLFCGLWLACVLGGTLATFGTSLGAFVQSVPHAFIAGGAQWVWPFVVSSSYWGVATGWVPALVAVLAARRRARPGGATPPERSVGTGDVDTLGNDAVAVGHDVAAQRRARNGAVAAVVVVALATAGVGFVSYGAESAAWTASHGVQPGVAPPESSVPTVVATPPPPTVAPVPTSPVLANRCTNVRITIGPVEAALGRRILGVYLTNIGTDDCVVEGFPGIAFMDAGGAPVTVQVDAHGHSTAERLKLSPRDSVRSDVEWTAGATAGSAQSATQLWVSQAAPATGTNAARFDADFGLDADSTVSLSPWHEVSAD